MHAVTHSHGSVDTCTTLSTHHMCKLCVVWFTVSCPSGTCKNTEYLFKQVKGSKQMAL